MGRPRGRLCGHDSDDVTPSGHCRPCRRERQQRARRRNRRGLVCKECDRPIREHGVMEFCLPVGRRSTSLVSGRVVGFETTPKYIDQEYI